MKYIFILSLLFHSSLSYAQYYSPCYNYKILKSAFFLQNNECEKSKELINQAFKEVNSTLTWPFYYLIAAKVSACNGDLSKTIAFLENSFKTGIEWNNIENIKYFEMFIDTDEWRLLKENYPKFRKEYHDKINIDVYTQILQMGEKEQTIRRYISANPKDTIMNNYLSTIDSLNIIKLKLLIEEKSFPSFSQIGVEGYRYLYLILLHGLTENDSDWDFFQKELLTAIKNGHFLPDSYTRIVDRRLIWGKNMPQLYGSFNWKDDKVTAFNEIEDIKHVDERRISIGLLPLQEEANRKGFSSNNKSLSLPKEYNMISSSDIKQILNCNYDINPK